MAINRYNTINGKRYFNWGCVGQLLLDMELKAEKVKDKALQAVAKDVAYASHYYINTGRASTDWVKAWTSANPDKLFKYVQSTYNGSSASAIQQITQYLQKYCKLSA